MPPRRGKNDRRGGKKGGGGNSNKPRSLDDYYTEIYGARWPALRAAMTRPAPKVALWNRFCQVPKATALAGLAPVCPGGLSEAYRPEGDNSAGDAAQPPALLDKPPLDDFGVRAYYLLDYASALIVEQLQVGPFDYVLDLCAAPGGKSVAACQYLSPDGSLVANESRGDRVARLRRTLSDHVPTNYVPWRLTQRDARTWHHPDGYTRVLVDAPCSSERHLLRQSRGGPVDTRDFSDATTAQLAELQRGILLRALETCRPGGRVVYSTCSISPLENDGVVSEVLRRTRCEVTVLPDGKLDLALTTAAAAGDVPPQGGGGSDDADSLAASDGAQCHEQDALAAPGGGDGSSSAAAPVRNMLHELGERTAHGWLLLPDRADGWGPMYCCVLHKISNTRDMMADASENDQRTTSSDEGE